MSRKKKKPRVPQQRRPEEPIHLVFPSIRAEPELPPRESPQSLSEYRQFLTAQLTFPLTALHIKPLENGRLEVAPVVVQRLLPLEEAGVYDGLMVEAKFPDGTHIVPLTNIQPPPTDLACVLIRVYTTWFEETSDKDEDTADDSSSLEPDDLDVKPLLRTFGRLVVYSAGVGAAWGAILKSVPGAETGAIVGSSVVGFLGLLLGLLFGAFAPSHLSRTIRSLVCGVVLSLIGAIIGALMGGVAVAYVGALPGGIVGSAIGHWLCKAQPNAKFTWGIAGACLGGLVYAHYLDADAARGGVGFGLLLGFAGVVLILVLLAAMLATIFRSWKV